MCVCERERIKRPNRQSWIHLTIIWCSGPKAGVENDLGPPSKEQWACEHVALHHWVTWWKNSNLMRCNSDENLFMFFCFWNTEKLHIVHWNHKFSNGLNECWYHYLSENCKRHGISVKWLKWDYQSYFLSVTSNKKMW